MIPILISIIILLVGAGAFYALFVRREELRHLSVERDAEIRHTADWKEVTKILVDGALVMRGLDTQDEAKLHAEMLHKDDPDREPTLEELEAEMSETQNPLHVSFEGEAGRRRELALKIHRLKEARDDGLIERTEELVGEHINSLDEGDLAHLGRAN